MATRSPSPNLSRPRTPEISNSLRKSKEIPQRNSLSKPSTPNSSPRASFEQKENVKSRSSAISSSKGSKNFMAPTISASSKAIVPPSPRKKILQERNEVISSVSDSVEFSMKEVGIGVEFEDIMSKPEMGFGSQEVLSVGQLRKGESRIKNQQNPSPLQAIAPLDADPSLPPYDPKTNYLSPRPQFLHYRPNPRIEQYLTREGEFLDVNNGRRLEDSFSLESSEDDDVTVLTEEKEKEKDSEEELLQSKVEEVESVNETVVSEPEIKVEPSKRWSFKRSKLVLFLLILAMACSYAPLSDSPISVPKIHSPSFQTFEDLQLNDYLAVVNGHFNGLVSRFKQSTDTIAYFSSMNLPMKDDVSLHHLANMSSLAIEETEGLDVSYKPKSEIEQPIKENLVEVSYDGNEPEVSAFVKEEDDDDDGAEYNAEEVEIKVLDENTETVSDEGKENEIGVSEDIMDADIVAYNKEDADNIEIVVSEDVKESELDAQRIEMGKVFEDVIDADTLNYGMEKEITEIIENTEIVPESEIIGDEQDGSDVNAIGHTESASSLNNDVASNVDYQISHGLELLKSTNYATMFGLALALSAVPATLAVLYMKQKQVPVVVKERRAIKKVGSVSGSSEPYPLSEVSTSWNNISMRDEEENLTSKSRLRRDSTASSSISYGSFTTYEKLSAKKGCRDEEVVTPVRRSSRIRNSMISP